MSAAKRRLQKINRRLWWLEMVCRHHGHVLETPDFTCERCGK